VKLGISRQAFFNGRNTDVLHALFSYKKTHLRRIENGESPKNKVYNCFLYIVSKYFIFQSVIYNIYIIYNRLEYSIRESYMANTLFPNSPNSPSLKSHQLYWHERYFMLQHTHERYTLHHPWKSRPGRVFYGAFVPYCGEI